MAFKMKSPFKKTYREAYKDADKSKYKTFESFKAAAERYNEKKYGTTQPTAKAKKFGITKSQAAEVVAKPPKIDKKPVIKTATVKPTKMEATAKMKRQDKRRAKKRAIASQAGKTGLERRLNYKGEKARARKAKRQDRKINK